MVNTGSTATIGEIFGTYSEDLDTEQDRGADTAQSEDEDGDKTAQSHNEESDSESESDYKLESDSDHENSQDYDSENSLEYSQTCEYTGEESESRKINMEAHIAIDVEKEHRALFGW